MIEKSAAAKLLLVRHGQDVDNARFLINGRRNSPLTELGRAQALAVAGHLRGKETVHCVYTSPLQRAAETASIISQELGIGEVRVEPDLIERDYGILTGKAPSDIPAIAREIVASHGFQYVIDSAGIEDYLSLWTRAGKVLRKIQETHANETVLIVAHNEIIKMIRANFEKKSWETELALPPIANCQVIPLEE